MNTANKLQFTDADIDQIAKPYAGLGGIEDYRAFARAILSRQSMMGSEVRGEIDERAAFEKFMSKRGWAAVYAGDGQYESPSVQDQWEAWQARAGISAPQEQAEHPSHETIISEGGKLVCTACGTTTPANAAAANGDGRKPDAWLVPSILSFEDRRTSCPVEFVGQLEGTVAWEAALFSDGDIDAVIDKHGVEHKPIPLYRAAADADGQKGETE